MYHVTRSDGRSLCGRARQIVRHANAGSQCKLCAKMLDSRTEIMVRPENVRPGDMLPPARRTDDKYGVSIVGKAVVSATNPEYVELYDAYRTGAESSLGSWLKTDFVYVLVTDASRDESKAIRAELRARYA